MNAKDHLYLQRCLHLAKKGGAKVFPNPYVGCVIVHNEQIIGEGFHPYVGGPHAEVQAIASVKDKSLLPSSILYVNLEPCCFHGRTPACSTLIIQHKIPRVIIGCLDPNEKVSGKGIQQLLEHGVEVICADDHEPYEWFNRMLFVNQQCKRSYITLKWAQSKDGFIAGIKDGKAYPVQITGKHAHIEVHKLRAQHHGIMVGRNTVEVDNPSLTTRKFPGEDPIRVIFDREGKLGNAYKLFQDGGKTIVLTAQKFTNTGKTHYYKPEQWEDLNLLIAELYDHFDIASILVEGGSNILDQFIQQELWDEIWRFEGDLELYEGVKAPNTNRMKWGNYVEIGKDKLWRETRKNWQSIKKGGSPR